MLTEKVKVSKLCVDWESLPADWNGGGQFLVKPRYKVDGLSGHLELGTTLTFRHTGEFRCSSCDRAVKKLFDAYCYPCFSSKAQADRCMMSPHLCHYLAGTCREPAWGESFCYAPHYVYVSYTDKYKVGITRETQLPTRWIDQGATMAAVVARVSSRHQSGVLEKLLCERLADKSHWLKMLKNGNERPSFEAFSEVVSSTQEFLKTHPTFLDGSTTVETPGKLGLTSDIDIFSHPTVVTIEFPIDSVPEKFQSANLEKSPTLSGKLVGIKGQYLLLDTLAFNFRRHEGWIVDCTVEPPPILLSLPSV